MSGALSSVKEVLARCRQLSRPLVIAIDGRCAAGKTTLAAALQRETGCPVLHLDHFFLRPEQRTPQRLAQPGGNVDWERFLAEVLLPLEKGRPFSYRPYDCHTQSLAEPVSVLPAPLVVVEGSYSCHPALWEHYGLHVFLTISPAEQLRRIRQRNGEEGLAAFRERWIPLEEAYFQAFSLPGRCELCLDMEGR